MPLSASPNYNPPIAPRNRTYPQQPTYINAQNMSKPVNAVYTPVAPPQEEVCLECAMRDQDMADVDVTSAGIWERASDAQYEELRHRELEEEDSGVEPDEKRPRYRGGRLTEQNLKLWLSIVSSYPCLRFRMAFSDMSEESSRACFSNADLDELCPVSTCFAGGRGPRTRKSDEGGRSAGQQDA